jgi:hypothetical protein
VAQFFMQDWVKKPIYQVFIILFGNPLFHRLQRASECSSCLLWPLLVDGGGGSFGCEKQIKEEFLLRRAG